MIASVSCSPPTHLTLPSKRYMYHLLWLSETPRIRRSALGVWVPEGGYLKKDLDFQHQLRSNKGKEPWRTRTMWLQVASMSLNHMRPPVPPLDISSGVRLIFSQEQSLVWKLISLKGTHLHVGLQHSTYKTMQPHPRPWPKAIFPAFSVQYWRNRSWGQGCTQCDSRCDTWHLKPLV